MRAAELVQTPIEEFKAFARLHGERPPNERDAEEPTREERAITYLDSLGFKAPQWLEESWQSAQESGADKLTFDEIQREVADVRREQIRLSQREPLAH